MFGLTGNSWLVIFKIISIGILVISTTTISAESHHKSVFYHHIPEIFFTNILQYYIIIFYQCSIACSGFTDVSETTGRKLRRKNIDRIKISLSGTRLRKEKKTVVRLANRDCLLFLSSSYRYKISYTDEYFTTC